MAALNAGDFKTVLGDLKFNDKGDVTLPGYLMYEWKPANTTTSPNNRE